MENQNQQPQVKVEEIEFVTPEGGTLFNYVPAQFIPAHYEVLGKTKVEGQEQSFTVSVNEGINRIPDFDGITNEELKNKLIELWQEQTTESLT